MTKLDQSNLDNIPNVQNAVDKIKQPQHTGGMYKSPWERYGGIGASVIGSIAGTGRTIIDPERLGEYIGELKTLSETVSNAAYKPVVDERCGGKTIAEIEAMADLLGDMKEALYVLIQKTISYMEGRKTSVETKEASSAAVVGAVAGAKATMQTK